MEILALSLADNGVILCYNHLAVSGRTIFSKWPPRASPRFVDVSEEEINFMKEHAIPRSTKHATEFGMTLFKDKM